MGGRQQGLREYSKKMDRWVSARELHSSSETYGWCVGSSVATVGEHGGQRCCIM